MFIQPFISYPIRGEKNSSKLKPRFAAEDQRSFLQDFQHVPLPDWYMHETRSTRSASPLEHDYLDFFEKMIEKDAYESGELVDTGQQAKATEPTSQPTEPRPIPTKGDVKPFFRPLRWKNENRKIDQWLFAHPGQWFTFAAITEGAQVKNHHISQYLTDLNDIEDETIQSKRAYKIQPNHRKREVLVIAYKPTEEPAAQNIRLHASGN